MLTELSLHINEILWLCVLLLLLGYPVVAYRRRTIRARAFLTCNFGALTDVNGEVTGETLLAANNNPAFRTHIDDIAFVFENLHTFGHPTGETEWVAESNQFGDFRRERAIYAVGLNDF